MRAEVSLSPGDSSPSQKAEGSLGCLSQDWDLGVDDQENSSDIRMLAPARRSTFAALSYPNYRLWFFGQMTSLFGTWMQSTAQAYLVYQLTRSEAYLGYVGFASGIASWVFMLYGGVIADRFPGAAS